jgi:sugar transferase EpsL
VYRTAGKRLVDLLLCAAALCALAPVMLAVAALIRVKLGRPVLFRQLRPGRDGKPFTMFKFRTMRAARPGENDSASDAARLTPFGSFLRKASLDELPELFNVLRGEMSVIGPRPLLMQYLPRYSAEQARRHEAAPGITGWAQVNGRNAISWRRKFELDVWYVDHVSFLLDLRILLLTAWHVLSPRDISYRGHATMPEFLGGGKDEE